MEEKESKQKNDRGLTALVIILAVMVLGMGVYIAYDKGIIFSSIEKETTKTNNDKKKAETDVENESNNEIEKLNLTKCINNDNNKYSNPTDVEGNYGLSMEINHDKTSITLSIDWPVFGPLSAATAWAPAVEKYQITGFTKNVDSAFVGDLGQSPVGITLFYLMSDGTVEYTPMFNRKNDSHNNSYYEMNYTYDYSQDGKVIGNHFSTNGTINGVSNVIKLYTADVANGSGWRTTIGAKKDGSFYDLGDIINH